MYKVHKHKIAKNALVILSQATAKSKDKVYSSKINFEFMEKSSESKHHLYPLFRVKLKWTQFYMFALMSLI